MESSFGFVGKDFILVAMDSYAMYSLFRFKDNEDKIVTLDDDKLLCGSGPQGDRVQFCEFIRKNVHLTRFRTGAKLSAKATANFARHQLATAIRKGPYEVNCLLAGFDEEDPSLYWIDYMGSMVRTPKAAHGYAAYFLGGLLDKYWKPELSLEEALKIAQLCKNELESRFLISQSKFVVKVLSKSGIYIPEEISA